MDPQLAQPSPRTVWALAWRQHGVVARRQLLGLGFGPDAIKHRVTRGRLHPIRRGIYAVGRAELSEHGRWMAAVLSCGSGAALSHASAAALWRIADEQAHRIEVSVPIPRAPRPPGIHVHRRAHLAPTDLSARHRIPRTSPVRTLLDLACRLSLAELETAINAADRNDAINPETLRAALDAHAGESGVGRLRQVLDRRTFALTDSELERLFMPLARQAGLTKPVTGALVNGFKVDFYWPELSLVVETDGLRYHHTPNQQARDRLRDQVHVACGLTCLRFTHAQVKYEPDHVQQTLASVTRRLTLQG